MAGGRPTPLATRRSTLWANTSGRTGAFTASRRRSSNLTGNLKVSGRSNAGKLRGEISGEPLPYKSA